MPARRKSHSFVLNCLWRPEFALIARMFQNPHCISIDTQTKSRNPGIYERLFINSSAAAGTELPNIRKCLWRERAI